MSYTLCTLNTAYTAVQNYTLENKINKCQNTETLVKNNYSTAMLGASSTKISNLGMLLRHTEAQ